MIKHAALLFVFCDYDITIHKMLLKDNCMTSNPRC